MIYMLYLHEQSGNKIQISQSQSTPISSGTTGARAEDSPMTRTEEAESLLFESEKVQRDGACLPPSFMQVFDKLFGQTLYYCVCLTRRPTPTPFINGNLSI